MVYANYYVANNYVYFAIQKQEVISYCFDIMADNSVHFRGHLCECDCVNVDVNLYRA